MASTGTRRQLLQTASVLAIGAVAWKLAPFRALAAGQVAMPSAASFPVRHTDAEWHRMLSPAQFDVLREEGTEAPFSSPLNHFYSKGTYDCLGCNNPAYASETKFDSGTGWPSFWKPLPNAVIERQDGSMGMQRTEVHCARCASHLGHVFDDGPAPTGLRYCMNGVALSFKPAPGVKPPQGA